MWNFQPMLTCFGNITRKIWKQFSLVYTIEHIPLYNPEKQRFFAEFPRLFTRSPKTFLDKIFISIRVRRKIPTLFLKKHGKTIPRRYQQLVRYSYNIAGKTLSFSLEMLINTEWTKKCYIKLWDLFPNFLWYFFIKFWKCFYITVLCSLGSS